MSEKCSTVADDASHNRESMVERLETGTIAVVLYVLNDATTENTTI